jgi:hypothetical protein
MEASLNRIFEKLDHKADKWINNKN